MNSALITQPTKGEKVDDAVSTQIQCDVHTELPYKQLLRFELLKMEIDTSVVDSESFARLGAAFYKENSCITISGPDSTSLLVSADPANLYIHQKVEIVTGKRFKSAYANASSIRNKIIQHEESNDKLKNVSQEFGVDFILSASKGDGYDIQRDDYSSPIVKLLNMIVATAIKKRVSDIHIETYEKSVQVKYRIDGVLYPAMTEIDIIHHSALVSRLKIMADLDIAEKRIPQDGRFKAVLNAREIDFRVSILPGIFGENIVIRILDNVTLSADLASLSIAHVGMDEEQVKRYRKLIREPYGMVLVTGPTGSGKTTTLYASLCEINDGHEKIITVEDPVEYQLPGITQVAVNNKKGLTFATGLRSILRHDPDKILVGEIRDAETAKIAVQSALTGHLVFSTVHANNVNDVIARFSNMDINLNDLISAINGVIAQRLIRLLCENCRSCKIYSVQEMIDMGFDEELSKNNFYEAAGCEKCNNTGYNGRTSIMEMLVFDNDLKQRIFDGGNIYEVMSQGHKGIKLRECAIEKAIQGKTSLLEVNRVTFA